MALCFPDVSDGPAYPSAYKNVYYFWLTKHCSHLCICFSFICMNINITIYFIIDTYKYEKIFLHIIFTNIILNCSWNKLDTRRRNKNKPLGCVVEESLHEYSLKISKLRNEEVHLIFYQKINVGHAFRVIYYTDFIKSI